MIAIRFFAMAHVTLAELVTFENCCKYLEIEFQQDWHKRFNQYFERNGNIYENDDLVLENLLTKIRRREVSFDQSMSRFKTFNLNSCVQLNYVYAKIFGRNAV